MSTLQEFSEAVRKSGPFRHLLPMEASLSYPVPRKSPEGAIYMDFLVFTIERVPKGQPAPVHRPFARITVQYPNGEWVEYRRLDHTTPGWNDAVLAQYEPQGGKGITSAQSREQRRRLYEAIEEVLPLMYVSPESANGARATMASCLRQWESAAEPGLSQEYRSLNPEFFDWLEAAVRDST